MRDATDPTETSDPAETSELSEWFEHLLAFVGDPDEPVERTPVRGRAAARPESSGWKLDRVPVRDLMTTGVVSVTATASYQDVLAVLTEHRLGAVPVVDDQGRVIGVVSESDLLAKVALTPDLADPTAVRRGARPATRRKAGAESAADLMSAPAVTVADRDSVVVAARTATRQRLRRLPVVDADGRLVGIVTRSDLLSAFRRDDGAIRNHVVRSVLGEQFCLPAGSVDVHVHDGVVSLTGELEREAVIPTLVAAVSSISGVVAVRDHLTSQRGVGR